MRISKTTINMAAKRNIALTILDNEDDGTTRIELGQFANDDRDEAADEYNASYRMTDDGLFWDGSCFSNSEEWPNWIPSESHLRVLLPVIAKEVNDEKTGN